MRVITYNIRGGLGTDGKRSTDRIADLIVSFKPDIVCFQEVHQRLPQSAFVDQPRRLQERLVMEVVFQANLKIAFGGYGLAIATRLPVQKTHNFRLPSIREQRGALAVTLEVPAGPLTVFCTHWGLNSEERQLQAVTLAEKVFGVQGAIIMCGDLNEASGGAAVQSLLSRTGFQDADTDQDRLTYPSDEPVARIDYILHSKAVVIENIFPVITQASDHLPVVADFSLATAQ